MVDRQENLIPDQLVAIVNPVKRLKVLDQRLHHDTGQTTSHQIVWSDLNQSFYCSDDLNEALSIEELHRDVDIVRH